MKSQRLLAMVMSLGVAVSVGACDVSAEKADGSTADAGGWGRDGANAEADGGVLPDGAASDGAASDSAASDGAARDGTSGCCDIEFRVTAPAGTPRYDTLWIAGNVAELGGWNPQGRALTRGSDGLYRVTVCVAAPASLEFKVTRGSWETVEKAQDGSEIPNRTHAVVGPATLDVHVAAWADRPTVAGNVENLGILDSQFVLSRPVLVYLPPGYEQDTTRRYPVLYMHDGQNVFDARTSFLGIEWGVDETAEALILSGEIEPIIIVAVGNTPDRANEYTPVYEPSRNTGGKADEYARFLIEELKPVIDARYRTLTDAAHTGVAGSSLGGLVSMYLGLTHSDVFQRLGVISPSVWWGDRYIVSRVQALQEKLPLRIWEDMGTAESATAIDDARALRDALLAKGWVLDQDLSYHEIAGAQHNEAAWAARVGDVLKFLFPRE